MEKKIPNIWVPLDKSRASLRQLLRGLVKYAKLHGPWKFHFNESLQPQNESNISSVIKGLEISAAVVCVSGDQSELKLFQRQKVPVVVIPVIAPIEGVPNLLEDCEQTGKMAADYLLSRGFRHFAYAGFKTMYWSDSRGEGFARQIRRHGHEVSFYKNLEPMTKHNWNQEHKTMAQWLQSLPKPIGLMTCNDDFGEQVIDACNLAHINIPEEAAILGVDDDDLICELCEPNLSSVAISHNLAGYQIGRLLDKLMSGEKWDGTHITIAPTHIVSRLSTDVLAIEDQDIAIAISYIRYHTRKRNVHVEEVVGQTAVSRRVLEKRFRKTLNCSINAKIRQFRLEHFCKMLVESTLPVSEIASDMGFMEIKHVANYFQKAMGTTPLKYRKKHCEESS